MTFVLAALAGVAGPVASSRQGQRKKAGGYLLTLLLFLSAGAVSVWPTASIGGLQSAPASTQVARPEQATPSPSTRDGAESASPTQSPSQQSLFEYTVTPDTSGPEYCETFGLPELGRLPAKNRLNADWAYQHGGATVTELEDQVSSAFYLNVQGTTPQAVVIHGITLTNVKLEDPNKIRQVVDTCPLGGGATGYRRLYVDPAAGSTELAEPDTGAIPDEPSRFPLQVSNADPEVFEIHVACKAECLAEFTLQIRWSSGRQSGVETVVRNFDRPFVTFSGQRKLPYKRV